MMKNIIKLLPNISLENESKKSLPEVTYSPCQFTHNTFKKTKEAAKISNNITTTVFLFFISFYPALVEPAVQEVLSVQSTKHLTAP